MKNMEMTIKNKDILEINPIENTPFNVAKTNDGTFITYGRVYLKTEKNDEEIKEWANNKCWESIALFCQGLVYEMLNNKK